MEDRGKLELTRLFKTLIIRIKEFDYNTLLRTCCPLPINYHELKK